ncbi:MAG: hypothetical protein GKS05_10810 [Nitrospirales bacterium]|nr:hypothetical protein [Nitrospirales bacterium]
MKLTKSQPENKHKKNLRGVRKGIDWPRLGLANPSKEHTEVSMDEVRRQALMMSTQGLAPSLSIKGINVSEKPKRKGRPRVTK